MGGSFREFVYKFDDLVKEFYTDKGLSSESFRRGPCLYFHRVAINYIRSHSQPFSEWLSKDTYFHELLYAILTAWGMNRAGGGPKLKDFDEFQTSIRKLVDISSLEKLRIIKLEDMTDKDLPLIRGIFEALGDDSLSKIMSSTPFVVASTKLLHHLIPDLFPPMDRTYTEYAMQRFNDKYKITGSMESFKNFWQILKFCRDTVRAIKPQHILTKWIVGKAEKYPMNTSIPKVIDNALVSYAWKL